QPLTAITMNVMAGLRTAKANLPEPVRELLDDILRDSRRASQILERTKRLFRHQSAQPASCNLNDVVREVVKVAMPRLREFDVRVTLALEPRLPNVHVDAVQMQQVLLDRKS